MQYISSRSVDTSKCSVFKAAMVRLHYLTPYYE